MKKLSKLRKAHKLLAIVLAVTSGLFWVRPVSAAVIAFDTATATLQTSATNTLSYSHTVTGSNPFLLICIRTNFSSTDLISTVKYNGVSATKLGFVSVAPNDDNVDAFYLFNPSTGTNTVAITGTAGATSIFSYAASYTGVSSAGIDASSTNTTASGGPPNVNTLTTSANNSWHIACGGSASGNVTAGTGTTLRTVTQAIGIFDNNAAITPAGSNTINMAGYNGTFGSTTIGFSIAPAIAAAPSNPPALLMFD